MEPYVSNVCIKCDAPETYDNNQENPNGIEDIEFLWGLNKRNTKILNEDLKNITLCRKCQKKLGKLIRLWLD